ncbi:MAG: AI-2E family transporter [Hyphomicrobiales bacterium]|nr:AI-2E family transporter [Hyphomicrobiales bacterium]
MTIPFTPHTLFWLGAAILLFLLVALFGPILTPFLLGGVIAYLLDPLVTRLSPSGRARGFWSLVFVALLGLVVIVAAWLLAPVLFDQFTALIENAPAIIERLRAFAAERWPEWLPRPEARADGAASGGSAPISGEVAGFVVNQLQSVLAGGLAVVNSLALLFITPVVAFFLLKDWRRLLTAIDRSLPRQDAVETRSIAGEIDRTLSAYLRGQLTVMLLLSAFFMAGMGVIGLNYGLVIGLAAGLLSFIPYVGAFVGFVVSGAVAAAQFWPDWGPIAAVLGVFLVGQAIEGNVLTPKIVGDNVRLHPVWLIFALLAFGYAFGFAGLLIAVPAAAVIGVLVRRGLQKYYASEAYLGESAPKAGGKR